MLVSGSNFQISTAQALEYQQNARIKSQFQTVPELSTIQIELHNTKPSKTTSLGNNVTGAGLGNKRLVDKKPNWKLPHLKDLKLTVDTVKNEEATHTPRFGKVAHATLAATSSETSNHPTDAQSFNLKASCNFPTKLVANKLRKAGIKPHRELLPTIPRSCPYEIFWEKQFTSTLTFAITDRKLEMQIQSVNCLDYKHMTLYAAGKLSQCYHGTCEPQKSSNALSEEIVNVAVILGSCLRTAAV